MHLRFLWHALQEFAASSWVAFDQFYRSHRLGHLRASFLREPKSLRRQDPSLALVEIGE